jgi:hypothetical protein
MFKIKVLSTALFIISLGLAYFLYIKIKEPIEEAQRIAMIEERVINKLKFIRDVQKEYLLQNNRYCGSWDTLQRFVNEGKKVLTQTKEYVITMSYGADTSIFKTDTLGIFLLKDSVFNNIQYPDININEISRIPFSGKQFDIFSDRISKGGVMVDVFEVKDTAPVNPKRRANNNEKALRVGSRVDVTTVGNWE